MKSTLRTKLYFLSVKLRSIVYKLFHYCFRKDKGKPCVIAIIDSTRRNGGLGDRFRHIISIYSFCKQNKLPFKLSFTDPVDIRYFFLPNKYDWRIKQEELSNSFFKSSVVFLLSGYKNKGIDFHTETEWQVECLRKAVKGVDKKQIHVFGNAHIANECDFSDMFEELFKPSDLLQSRLNEMKLKTGETYSAAVFRFQNLLGDLKERGSRMLNDIDQKRLMQRCKSKLIELHDNGQLKNDVVLVTSDSVTFLKFIVDLDFIKTIPGEIAHPDYDKNAAAETYLKSYVDLLMLSDAEEIILFQTERMYQSGFPQIAAQIGNKPFRIINW